MELKDNFIIVEKKKKKIGKTGCKAQQCSEKGTEGKKGKEHVTVDTEGRPVTDRLAAI